MNERKNGGEYIEPLQDCLLKLDISKEDRAIITNHLIDLSSSINKLIIERDQYRNKFTDTSDKRVIENTEKNMKIQTLSSMVRACVDSIIDY